MTKQKLIVIVTALSLNKNGNQSLKRFVEMFLQRNFHVVIYTTAISGWEKECTSGKKLEIKTIKGLSRIIQRKMQKQETQLPEQVCQNFYSKLKSEEIIPPFGTHGLRTLFKKWLLFTIRLFDNLKLASYFILNPNKLRKAAVIIGYECGLTYSAKIMSKIFKKTYINKYQGTILKNVGSNLKQSIMYYPYNYFGINKSELCLMVNDGTKGDYYARKRGCKNIYFEPHGVAEKEYAQASLEQQYVDLNFTKGKFVIFNNASGSVWKRPDRFIRPLQYLNSGAREKIILLTTYHGHYKKSLKNLVTQLNIGKNVVFLENIDHFQSHYIMMNSHIVCMTNEMSNLGNPVLEAIYFGIPVITIDDGSTEGFIENNKNGVLIKLDENFDINFARTIESLVENPKFYKKLKKNAEMNSSVKDLRTQQNKEFEVIKPFIK